MDKTKYIVWIFIGLIALAGLYYYVTHRSNPAVTPPQTGVEYRNTQYGFAFKLPDSWKGYTVTIDKWTGNVTGDVLGETAYATGPVVSIHNPKWTGGNSYQDIPIMVFTTAQWNELQADKFHIGAAPINPSELGRNSKYVFALPARYNYSFPPGYEEVDVLIQNKSNFSTF